MQESEEFNKKDDQLVIPFCDKCGSKQVRTVKKYLICIRCGYREELKKEDLE